MRRREDLDVTVELGDAALSPRSGALVPAHRGSSGASPGSGRPHAVGALSPSGRLTPSKHQQPQKQMEDAITAAAKATSMAAHNDTSDADSGLPGAALATTTAGLTAARETDTPVLADVTAATVDETDTPDVVRQLAEARVALAERDCEVDALHRQTMRLADRIDRLTTGLTTGDKRDAVASELNERLMTATAELAAARADAAEARDALQEASLAAAEARVAADAEAVSAAGLARQVAALRVVLAGCVTEEHARAEAAAAREQELSESAAAAEARAATAEAAAAASEAARAAISKQLDDTRRELRKLTSTSGSWVGDADATGRVLLLQHRASERRAEQLAELLLEREEQLSYYKRHVTALEGHLLEARREAAEATRQVAALRDQQGTTVVAITSSSLEPGGNTPRPEAAAAAAAVAVAGTVPPLTPGRGLAAEVQQQQQQQQQEGWGVSLTPRRTGKDAQDTIARLKDELRAKDKALKEAQAALTKAESQIHGLQVVQVAKTAINNRFEGEVWQLETRVRTATSEIARLEAALAEATAEAEAARGEADAAEEKATVAAGQVAAARLQVAALLEGLLHDHRKATRTDPQGYAQLRSEAADILSTLPSEESRQRYAVLYKDSLIAALQQQQQHGGRGGTHGHSHGRASAAAAVSASRRGTASAGGDAPEQGGSWLAGGSWLLQAAGFRRRSSSCCGTAGGAASGGGGSEWGSAAGGSGGGVLLSPKAAGSLGHRGGGGGHRGSHKHGSGASGVPRPSTSCGTIAEDGVASRTGSGTRSGAATPRAGAAALVRHPSAQLP